MSGLATNIYAAVAIPFVVASLSMVGRVFARRMTKVPWWWEDYFCVTSYVTVIAYNSVVLYWTTHWSLGQIIPDTTSAVDKEHILEMSRKLSFAGSLTYSLTIAFSKLTVLSLYWRIFSHSGIRKPIIVMFVICVVWIILRIFMVTFRCWPVPFYWDKTISGGECKIRDAAFFFGTVLPHFVMDVVILILPVVQVFKLRLRFGQKIGVAALFVLGTIVCFASVFVLYYSLHADQNSNQLPYEYYSYNFMWGAVEVNTAIVSSCFPLLRPIFRYFLGSKAFGSYTEGPFTYATPHHELTSITITKSKRDREPDSTSSTHQLADEHSIPDMPDLESSIMKAPDRVHTTISSRYHVPSWTPDTQNRGIHVRNDVVVEVRNVDADSLLHETR